MDTLDTLQETLGHSFKEISLLEEALTHASISGNKKKSYERMEFLGDRVLGLVIAEELLIRFPSETEGDIAKRHTALVRKEALAKVAHSIDLPRFITMSHSEKQSGGDTKPAILADVCEAVIAALYLDSGLEKTRAFIRKHWSDMMDSAKVPPHDIKSHLQEWLQSQGLALPEYQIVERSGPDHDPVFVIEVKAEGYPAVTGSAGTKRAAEKEAAKNMLEIIRNKEKEKPSSIQ